MENKQIIKFNMYEMIYKGGAMESNLSFIPFEEKYYEQYVNLIDTCYYEMRKALNIRPYDKHSYSLEESAKLKEGTFLLLDGDIIICAVTCSRNNVENVAVNLDYQRQGYGQRLIIFALNYMQKHEYSPIKLSVTKWNTHAIKLYESLGFEIVKESIVNGINTKGADGNWSFEFTEADGLDIR